MKSDWLETYATGEEGALGRLVTAVLSAVAVWPAVFRPAEGGGNREQDPLAKTISALLSDLVTHASAAHRTDEVYLRATARK